MGSMWLHWSIHPSPLSLFPGAALCRLESRGNISVVASGCSWFPPFPWILGARAPAGASPAALNALPSALYLSKLFPPGLGLFLLGPVQGQALRNCFPCTCVMCDICSVVLKVHGM